MTYGQCKPTCAYELVEVDGVGVAPGAETAAALVARLRVALAGVVVARGSQVLQGGEAAAAGSSEVVNGGARRHV